MNLPTKSATLKSRKHTMGVKYFPVHGDASASGEVDLMDDSTAGNREMVTVNTKNTLVAYTQI